MKRALAVLMTICLLAGMVAGCAQPSGTSTTGTTTTTSTTTTTTSTPAEIEQTLHLSYATTTLYNDYDFVYPWTDTGLGGNLLWLTLLSADKELNAVKGEIMSDWKMSDDGLTLTMTMRDDLVWSDGTPITMDDILWTFGRIAQQQYWSYVYSALTYIEGQEAYAKGEADSISGITADGNVLTIKLKAPFAAFVNLMAQVAPLPKHIYENCDFGPDAAFKKDPIWKEIKVNSGPFIITEHKEKNYYIMEPNPLYKGEESKIKKIVFTATDSPVALAQTGNIDFMGTQSADDYKILSDLNSYRLEIVPIIYFRFLVFNFYDGNDKPKDFVSDLRVRQAIAQAVDWKTVVGGLFGDQASLTQSGVLASDPNYSGDWYSYDPDKAKALLDEAKFDYSHTLKIFYYYTDQTTIDLMDAIAYYLDQIGVKMEAVYTSNSVADIYEGRTHDIAYFGLSAYNNLSWYQMYLRPTMDKMLKSVDIFKDAVGKLETAYTDELWKTAISELQTLERENLFYLPVYTLNYQCWLNDRLSVPEGCFGNNWYFYDYQFENWEIVK